MKRVNTAIEKGRCVVAVAGSLLKDASLMLALTERSALPSIALSGPAVAPVQPPSPDAVARAVGQPGGVLVLVEPELVDMGGVKTLTDIARRAPHQPEIVVVSKAFNPFLFGRTFEGFKVTHEKGRGQRFVLDLPMPPSEEAVPAPSVEVVRAAKKGPEGMRFVFVGRDDEVAALAGLLGEGGPIVVSGPPGVGRSLLVEHAVEAAGLARLPDLAIGFGSGADTLATRIGAVAEAGGSDLLVQALRDHAKPARVAAAAVEALQAAAGTEGQVMVIRHLDWAMGRQADFFRKSRLEMLLEALLTAQYPLRLVFVSERQPTFYREAHNQAIRRFEVGGLKGRFLREIFEAFHAPEFPAEKFGPIAERTHGHALAARTFAVSVRERGDGLERVDDPKFLAAKSLDDLKPLEKELGKRVEKVKGGLRQALATAAHFGNPVSGKLLADMGISRKDRTTLIHLGLLDVVGTQEGAKRYRVHPLVRQHLSLREISDFDTLRKAADLCGSRASRAEGVERVYWAQRSARYAELGRDGRGGYRLDLPDDDAFLDSISGLLRRKEPRYDIVEQQVRRILNRNSANADAHLLRLRAMFQAHAKQEAIAGAIEQAIEQAPVPEVYHQADTLWLHRRARVKAIQVLEHAVEALPDHSRLRARLAALLMKQGRRPEAIAHLHAAMELDPQLPDAYGLLGLARREEGTDKLDEAEQLLREAVRLAPEDGAQVSRLAGLLLEKARVVEFEERDNLRAEAREILERVLRGKDKHPEIQLLLATLIREEGGDPDRADWMLNKAKKKVDRGDERRFRIQLEQARVQAVRGNLDAAEKRIRELADKDPSNDRVFAALAEVLVVRKLFIPAHAEYMRARERTPPKSLARQEYETEITRLQALIEAQAAGLYHEEEPAAPAEPELHSASAFRVIRRRKDEEAGEQSEEAAPVAAPAAPAAEEAAPAAEEAAPTEDEAAAPTGEQPNVS